MKKHKKGFRRRSGPRRKKTYQEVMALQKDEFAHSTEHEGVVFKLYDTIEDQRVSIEELVQKFYRIILPEKGVKRSEIIQPVLFKLMDDPHSGLAEKSWFVIFRGNFFVNIYQTTAGKSGPHRAELWFKSFTTKEAWWIATLQIVAYFFNEKEMRAELMKCIAEREWFFDPSDAKRSVIP